MSSYNENFNSKLDWAMPFLRTGKYPLDRTDLFDSLEDALKYALGDGSDSRGLGKSSYIGLIITVYENDVVLVYKIDPDRTISLIGKSVDLSNYAEKGEIPTKISQLENDANYIKDSWDSLPNGVYAVSKDGNPVMFEDADETCIAAALIVNDAPVPLRFMIAKNHAKNDSNKLFSFHQNADATYYDYLIDNIHDGSCIELPELYQTDYKTWTNGAISDFNGKKNTNAIIDSNGSDFDKGNDQDLYETIHAFNSGIDKERYGDNYGYSDWYVPALGQCGLIIFYSEKLIELFTKIGYTDYIGGWSSTQGSIHPYMWDITDWRFTSNESPNLRYGGTVCYIRDIKSLTETINNLLHNKADKTEIPTKMSQLLDDVFDLASTTNNGLMSASDKTKLDSINNVYYGVCNTESSSAYKVVQLATIQLKVGTIVNVYHYNTNTATKAYLVINNLVSYPIFYKWDQNISSALTVGGLEKTVLSYIFTGSNFCYIGPVQSQSQSSNWWWATGIQNNDTTLIFNCTGFTKTNGMQITIPFTGWGWGALNMYLNINNTGACPVVYSGSTTLPSGLLSRGKGGSYITVVYYNNNYYILSVTKDNLSQFNNDCGFVQSSRVDTIETSVSSLGSQMITGDIKYIKKVTSLPDNPDSNTLYILI